MKIFLVRRELYFCFHQSFRPTAVELSFDSCRTIIQQLSDEREIYIGRLLFSKEKIDYRFLHF